MYLFNAKEKNNKKSILTKPGKFKKFKTLFNFDYQNSGFLNFKKNEILYDVQKVNDRMWLGKKKNEDGTFSRSLLFPSNYVIPFTTPPTLLQQSCTFVISRDYSKLSVALSTNPLSTNDALGATVEAKWIEASTSCNFNTLRPIINIFRDIDGKKLQPKIQLFLGKVVGIHRNDPLTKIMQALEAIGHHIYAAFVSFVRWRAYYNKYYDYNGKDFDKAVWVLKKKCFPKQIYNIDIKLKVKDIVNFI